MNSKIYKQLNSKWSSLAYPTKNSSFGGNGCGCCALVHIAIEQPSKRSWTPNTLRPWMIKQGYAVAGQGTRWEGITAGLKYIGHKKVVWIKREDPMSKAWAELKKGNRIGILLVSDGMTPDGTYWTSSGHYVAFLDFKVTKNGKHKFYIKDSGGRDHDGWYTYERSIKGALPQMWIVEKTAATRLAEKAREFAWYTKDELKNAPYPEGKAKPAYTKALDKYFGKNRGWQDSARKGASCDVYDAASIRAAGIDKNVPRGMGRSYLDKSDKFDRVNVTYKTIQNGDIISIIWKNGNPHWAIAYNGYTLEASLKGWYPKRTNTLKSRLSKAGKQSVVVYRAK